MIEIDKGAQKAITLLQNEGFEAYVVGGCVRDSLLGITPNDWDLCTNAVPDDILKVFENYRTTLTGKKHGTITVVINDEHYEITTYRVDGEHQDGRRPKNVSFTSDLQEDLRRRDFTINAMAYNYDEGLIDLFNGIGDLEAGIVRCVGNTMDRLNEDKLRIFRAIRFASTYDFVIDSNIYNIAHKNSDISMLSIERIQDEFNKILLSSKPSTWMYVLHSFNLLHQFIPELVSCYNFKQHNPHHHLDIFEHTIDAMDNVEPKLELRLSALFHDIGKPNTFSLDEDGNGHFYGHHKESAKICRETMTRLRYSNEMINYVSELVYFHMTGYENLRPKSTKKFISKVGVDKLDDLFKLQIADRCASKPPYCLDDIYTLKYDCERILSEKQPLTVKDLIINGNHLISLGVPEGKEIGEILNDLLEKVLENPELNSLEPLTEIVKNAIINKGDRQYG